jgi:hypothetical protein
MTPALILALALMASDPAPVAAAPAVSGPTAPAPAAAQAPAANDADPIGAIAADNAGEPLPAGAPTDDYQLTAWCYGALGEYLEIYDRVKPDLQAIDKLFGTSVPDETEPYHDDILAMRGELKILAEAVEAAEKASPTPIAEQGVDSIKLGRSIWRPAEAKTRRELARAWLSWGLPDRCDLTAKTLAARSQLLGKALSYNSGADAAAPAADLAPGAPPILQPIAPPVIHNGPPPAAPPAPPTPAPPAPAPASPPSP